MFLYISPYWLLDIKNGSIDDRIDLLDEEGKIGLFNYIDFYLRQIHNTTLKMN